MYDNATSVQFGHVNSVRAKLTKNNPEDVFVRCNDQSLNLAALIADSVDVTTVTFF